MNAGYRSRAAERGARTRIEKDSRRDKKPRRTSEEVDEERATKGKPTLSEQRAGLPPPQKWAKMATHGDEFGRTWVSTEDAHVFGVTLHHEDTVPLEGQNINLTSLQAEGPGPIAGAQAPQRKVIRSSFRLGAKKYLVFVV